MLDSRHDARGHGTPRAAPPALDRLRSELEATKHRAQEVADGLSVVEFNERLRPGSWSISECLSHLVTTGEAYLPVVETALRNEGFTAPAHTVPAVAGVDDLGGGVGGATPEPGDRLRLDLGGRLLVWLMEPPPKLRFPAPQLFAPARHLSVRRVLPPFIALQERLIGLLVRCEGLDLYRIRVVSPANRFLRPRLGAFFAIMAAHERRHLWRAEQIREELLMRRIPEEHPILRGVRPPEDLPREAPAEKGGATPS